MAGTSNISGKESITFTDNMSFDGTERGGAMTTNGQLWIGSTVARHVKLGRITSPGGTLTIGYASPNITIDLAGGGVAIDSFTPNSGTTPVVPDAAGNITLQGTGSITTVGGLNSLTPQLTGLTNHALQIGAGTATLTQLSPSATSGVPLISQGAAADPAYGTAVVAGGGTGATSLTAYAVLCGGTTSTSAVQPIASVGTATHVLTSNGPGALPTFQAPAAGGIPTIGTSTDRAIATWNGTGGNALYDNPNLLTTSAGAIKAAYGSSGAPAYAFVSAPTTGIYGGAFQIFFVTGGSSNFNIANTSVNNNMGLSQQGYVRFKRTATATDYTVQTEDYIIGVTSTAAARTITLPNSGISAGHTYVIKDESGAAGTNNINVVVSGGTKTVDGVTSYPINVNYGSITVYYNGTNYFIE